MDISNIYKKSFYITKKFKYLWVLGAAVAIVTASGGINFSNPGGSSSNTSSTTNVDLKSVTDSKNREILTESTSALNSKNETSSFSDMKNEAFLYSRIIFSNIKEMVSIPLVLLLVFIIVISSIISVFIRLVIKGWVIGSLIGGGIDAVNDNVEVNLKTVTTYGKRNIREMILLLFIPSFILGMTNFIIILTIVLGGIFSFVNSGNANSVPLYIGLFMLFMLISFIISIVLTGSMLYAQRLCIHKKLKWKESLIKGFYMFKHSLGDTFLLSIVNAVSNMFLLIGIMVIAIIPVLIVGGLIALNNYFLPVFIFIGVILLLPISILSTLIVSWIQVFKYSTWNLLYLELLEKKEVNNG